MTRTIPINLMTRQWGQRTIRIKPHWAGQGIAIHKPVTIADDGHPAFGQVQGYWRLTHIPTGLSLGGCMGSLDRAKTFAREWDAEFAALQPGQAMASDRLKAWAAVVEEMQRQPRSRRSRIEHIEAGN
jgi:hypothetical protein